MKQSQNTSARQQNSPPHQEEPCRNQERRQPKDKQPQDKQRQLLSLLSLPSALQDSLRFQRLKAASQQLKRNEDIREEFTFGDDSLLSQWKQSIVRELVDPSSTMDKQELAVAHKVISRLLEAVESISEIEQK